MELNNYDTSSAPGCARPVKGCAIAFGIIIMIFIGIMVWMVRLPGMQNLITCQSHITAVGQAVDRYKDVTGKYPDSLEDIRKEYIKNQKVLRCPLDLTPGNTPSYTYHKPASNSPDSFIMLECNRHRIKKELPVTRLVFTKGGKTRPINPTADQIVKEEKRQQKTGASQK